MNKTILIYGGTLAGAILLLKGIEHYFLIQVLPTPLYIILSAFLFTGLGIWLGWKISTKRAKRLEPDAFERNEQAIKSLGISERELDVLELLALGYSNQDIADRLFISVNTVKTHLSSLYQKLEINRRSLAVKKARTLKLIP